MSLAYIPFQPIYFGELPDDCCSPTLIGTCRDVSGVGGLYANLVQYNDVTQFQLVLGLCEDAEQVVENPNFEGTQSEQLVEDPTFENGVDEFYTTYGPWVAGSNEISLEAISGSLTWAVPVGVSQPLTVRLTISEIDGTLSISDGLTVTTEIDTAGTYQFEINATFDVFLSFFGDNITLTLFEVYTASDVSDWITTGSVIFENGIATIIGTPQSFLSQIGTLAANSTYLVEINVIALDLGDAEAAALYTDAEGVQIQSTGVQQFVIATGVNPYISVLASGGSSISIQYIRAYEWFAPEDITVEIIPYGEDEAIATLGDESKYISTDALTVSVDWDTILADDNPLPEGLYYFRVTDCDGNIESQPVDLATTHSCTFAIRACMDVDAFGFDFTAFSPFIRLRASFAQPEYPNADRLRFIDTRDRATNAYSVISKIKTFKTEFVPEYVLDFLGTLSGYSTLWLGNSQYSVENPSLRPDPNPEFISWGSAELELRMVNHPLRMSRCSSVVKDCTPPPNCWLWEDGTEIDWEDSEMGCVLYN